MKRKNVLDKKYFVTTEPLAALSPTSPREKIIHGQIVGEAAEGWFLADYFNVEFETITQSLMRIEELKDAEFFVELADLGNRVHAMQGVLSRRPKIQKTKFNAGE
jgi:hypothetical protein